MPFRPSLRPSIALLTVVDDGEDSGEVVRIRGERFSIGRSRGDLVIPHDGGISGEHAEITRRWENGQYNWYLTDLKSTNGTFIRASKATLHNNQELLIGGRSYKLEANDAPPPSAPAEGPIRTQKMRLDGSSEVTAIGAAMLVEVTDSGAGRRWPLIGTEQWIGRDRSCSIQVDDPMLSPRHARLSRDTKGRWVIENNQSLNKIWFRVPEAPLERAAQFQCGEQRFGFKVL